MPPLYVNEQGATVRKKDNQILVTKDGKSVQEVPINKIDQLIVMGRGVQVSTALLVALMELGIPVTITNQRGSRHYATLAPGVSRFAALRTAQMRFTADEAAALPLARAMIAAKLVNQRRQLATTRWPAAAAAIVQIDAAAAGLAAAPNIESVRGYEGAAAAAYFGAWRASLPPAWDFGGRAFYPPPDPVNAMLSFGYTLALNDVMVAVQITGLDPYIGTFHMMEAGRPSLALDLLEEFRPLLVDRLVLDLIGRSAVAREQFERPSSRPDAVYLSESGRAILVDRYEVLLNSPVMVPGVGRTSWRLAILAQAQMVARVIRGEQREYVGLTP